MFDLEENLSRLRDTHISYPFLNEAEVALRNHVKYGFQSTSSQMMALIGPAGCGKTDTARRVAKDIVQQHAGEVDHGDYVATKVPVVWADVPSDGTQKGIQSRLLRSIGDPKPAQGTVQEQAERLYSLVKRCETKVIIVDEVHHLVEKNGEKTRYLLQAANTFKDILATFVPVIIIGTEAIYDLLDHDNKQLWRRTRRIEEFTPFGYDTVDNQLDFQDVVAAFERNLRLPVASDLAQPDMAARIHHATMGRLGFLFRLLQCGLEIAHHEGEQRLTRKTLALAYHKGANRKEQKNNPFSTRDIKEFLVKRDAVARDSVAPRLTKLRGKASGSSLPEPSL